MLKHGDVYWANLDLTVGSEIRQKRPCIFIGATPINEARRTIVVVPLSSGDSPRPPLAIPMKCLGKQVIAVCDQIRAIDKSRLIEQAGSVSKEDILELEKGLRQARVL